MSKLKKVLFALALLATSVFFSCPWDWEEIL